MHCLRRWYGMRLFANLMNYVQDASADFRFAYGFGIVGNSTGSQQTTQQ